MSNKLPAYPDTPVIDYDKLYKRWSNLVHMPNTPKPVVGLTKRQLVWKKNKSSLWHYPAQSEKRHEVPIFLVYSLFNKPFILDLAPGSSLIEGLVKEGYDVYLLDWGIISLEDSDMGIDDYITEYLHKSVQRAIRHSGAKEITLTGYCFGGTIASIYAAIADNIPIKNLIVFTVPIDFSIANLPSAWVEAMQQDGFNINRLIDAYGVIPAEHIDFMFKMRRAPGNFFNHYAVLFHNAWKDGYIDKWRKMSKWTDEQVPWAGEAFRQLINDYNQGNKLVKGELEIKGKRVDLSNIKANLLIVQAKRDDMVLEEQAKPLLDLVSSKDKTYEVFDAGHVSMALSRKFVHLLDNWLNKRSNGSASKKY